MSSFCKQITPYVNEELAKAKLAEQDGDAAKAFTHLENAHVLGQEATLIHVKVHYLMLVWGIKQKSLKEVIGQIIRLIGAAALTRIKGVPIGNTGGSNVSAVKPMPIKKEHAEIIAKAKNNI